MATESLFTTPTLGEKGARILCEILEEGFAKEKAWYREHPNGDPEAPHDPLVDKAIQWAQANS